MSDNETASLRYEIEVPQNLNNDYQNKESKFEWKFKINDVNNNLVKTDDLSSYLVVSIIILITSIIGIAIFKKNDEIGIEGRLKK